jgi:hypothetical protein
MSRTTLADLIETADQLRAICREEINAALAARPLVGVDCWVERVSAEIAADILRNFEVTAKGADDGNGKAQPG